MNKGLDTLGMYKRLLGAHNVNINKVYAESSSTGQRIADTITSAMGSWHFVIIQTLIIACWITLNSLGFFVWHWDPFPFIFLNLAFSAQAAYATPLIMMSQNRQAAKDHLQAEADYHVNQASFSKLEEHSRVLEQQNDNLLSHTRHLESIGADVTRLTQLVEATDRRLQQLQKKATGA